MTDKIDSGSMAVMKALWFQNRNQVESTYNKLFNLTKTFHDMAGQTFSNKIKKLRDEGYINKSIKEESKLKFKPSVYTLSKRGLQAVRLCSSLIEYKEKQLEEVDEMSQEEFYRRLCEKTLLAVSSVPIFILLGHKDFIRTYIYDMAITWIEILDTKMHANMEEALKTMLPLALALTVEIGRKPLPDSLIDDLNECVRQWNLEPEEIFDKSGKLGSELKELILGVDFLDRKLRSTGR